MRFAITDFTMQAWEPQAFGTLIEGISPSEMEVLCDTYQGPLVDGYASFCKHLFLLNETPTRCGHAPITDENRWALHSGYRARREGELPVLERWFEGIDAPPARWLDVILYSRAQLILEAAEFHEPLQVPDCDWGIVAVIGVLEPAELPMPPITQMRNALGRAEGGSGVALDRVAYLGSVRFWEEYAPVLRQA